MRFGLTFANLCRTRAQFSPLRSPVLQFDSREILSVQALCAMPFCIFIGFCALICLRKVFAMCVVWTEHDCEVWICAEDFWETLSLFLSFANVKYSHYTLSFVSIGIKLQLIRGLVSMHKRTGPQAFEHSRCCRFKNYILFSSIWYVVPCLENTILKH